VLEGATVIGNQLSVIRNYQEPQISEILNEGMRPSIFLTSLLHYFLASRIIDLRLAPRGLDAAAWGRRRTFRWEWSGAALHR
jgi:hypothetical protein